jgi:hypothetical protein
MPRGQYVGPFDAQIQRMLDAGTGLREIGRILGIGESSVRRVRDRLRTKDAGPVADSVADPEASPDEIVLTNDDAPQIRTLDALLAHASLSLDEWEVLECTPNAWTGGDGSQHFQIKARLRRRRDELAVRRLWDALHAQLAVSAAARPRIVAPEVLIRRRRMYEVAAFDVHLGKLCWKPETGTSYDLDIAARDFRWCTDELLHEPGRALDELVLPVGNDFYHYDNLAQTTTGGTPQDGDSRFPKMYATGVELWVELVERALALGIRRIRLVGVPGNHDRLATYTLICTLAAWFRSEPRVHVDTGPALRKYLRYGTNMLCWTHGSEEKVTDLAVILATERPEMWAATQHREVHLGHLHTMKAAYGDSVHGVRVRRMPSISGTDAWHHMKGYADRRAMEAYLFDYESGYAGHFSANLLPVTAEAA